MVTAEMVGGGELEEFRGQVRSAKNQDQNVCVACCQGDIGGFVGVND